MNLMLYCGLAAKLVAPMAMLKESIPDEEALAASSPDLVDVAIHALTVQVTAFLPPIMFSSTYLITSGMSPKLGFLTFAYLSGGFLFNHVFSPWPTPEEGIAFMGFKIHTAHYINATFMILNLAAAMTVDTLTQAKKTKSK
jgi:hypothetical protein